MRTRAGDSESRLHENVAMPEPTPIDSNELPLNDPAPRSTDPSVRYSYTYGELLRFYWPPIVARIIFAGGCYAILVAAGAFCLQLWEVALGRGQMDISGLTFVGLPFYVLLLAAMGILWASFVAIYTLPVVHLVAWSLRLRTGLVWLRAFSGGLIGFVAAFPLAMDLPDRTSSQYVWRAITMLAVGPGLTTVLGQLGGALGGLMAAKRAIEKAERHSSLMAIGWRSDPAQSAHTGPWHAHQPPFQFRIAHLLWIGAWLSLLLAAVRLSGIPYEFILPLLLGWLIYQAATL